MEPKIHQPSRFNGPSRTWATANLELLRSRIYKLPWFSAVRAKKHYLLELALFLGAYMVYLLTRGLIFSDQSSTGLVNAGRVINLEKSLGIFWEPGWQTWILSNAQGVARFFNWTYILTYWPIIMLAGLALFCANQPRYRYYRSVVVINLAFALPIFMLFPVTSPFNVTAYFVNTIQELGPSLYGSPEMATFYNAHAAMPSLHFSWTVILGVLFLRSFKGWFRLIGVVYPVTTFFAIILTGNHFILDAVAGGLLALIAFAVMEIAFRGGLYRGRRRLAVLGTELRLKGTQYSQGWQRSWESRVAMTLRNSKSHWETKVRIFSSRALKKLPVGFRRRLLSRRGTLSR